MLKLKLDTLRFNFAGTKLGHEIKMIFLNFAPSWKTFCGRPCWHCK